MWRELFLLHMYIIPSTTSVNKPIIVHDHWNWFVAAVLLWLNGSHETLNQPPMVND